MPPEEVAAILGVDVTTGLTRDQARAELARVGPNEIVRDRPPSVWQVALGQLKDPMTLMLIVVAAVSFVIAQPSTAWVVIALVLLNVVMGTNQELKARASVSALASLQVPMARVTRDGTLTQIEARDLVPGDLVSVEAGDIVPADGRLVSAATLETQEAALTGESTTVAKGVSVVEDPEAPLGDRSDMVFQNTSVTRGSGTFLVTATGMRTEVGRIATMLGEVRVTNSPLQVQLGDLTRTIAIVAWGALVVILAVGLARGLPFSDLMLLGISMGISAIPTGLPTFVQTMLAFGAKELARAKAIVRSLNDVETLGATTRINTDKTGTLTLNQMTARAVFYAGQWLQVSGEGYATQGRVRSVAGATAVDLVPLAYVCALASDAVVAEDGAVVGDPTELAVVVLAEKLGVSVAETRRAYPRAATVPFDSDYKFMATFHHVPYQGEQRLVAMVKGGPDVILARCATALRPDGTAQPLAAVREGIDAASEELGRRGLRVLAMAVRPLPVDSDVPPDPMAEAHDLVFLGLVGIVDPLRPEAVDAVRMAQGAGIEVRMITGDHLVTAEAIGDQLGLGGGGMTGAEFARTPDADLVERLPHVHVFGRVSPEDKLRLVRLQQSQGEVVAMTGDAVNDAAALKQAAVGVAMGSGSEVSKQAAKMVLTDDNFSTLVTAIALGRGVYSKIVSYIGYQMSQLFALVLMFLLATAFNVNQGVAMLPLQVLFLNFVVAILPVIIITTDPPDPDAMHAPPRPTDARIFDRSRGIRWILLGLILGSAALLVVAYGPGDASVGAPSTPVTMGFVVIGLGTAFAGLTMHRTPAPFWAAPFLRPFALTVAGVLAVYLATEVGFLQSWLETVPLTGGQWLVCFAAAAVLPVVVELDKARQRRRAVTG